MNIAYKPWNKEIIVGNWPGYEYQICIWCAHSGDPFDF